MSENAKKHFGSNTSGSLSDQGALVAKQTSYSTPVSDKERVRGFVGVWCVAAGVSVVGRMFTQSKRLNSMRGFILFKL